MQMIWHDDEFMKLKFTCRYIQSQHVDELAFRSDGNRRRPMLVFVVAKNTRELPRIASGRAFRAAGAKERV